MLFALREIHHEKRQKASKNRQKSGTEKKVGVDFSEGRGDAHRRMAECCMENPAKTRFCGGYGNRSKQPSTHDDMATETRQRDN